MTILDLWALGVIALLLVLAGVFGAAETTFSRLTSVRAEHLAEDGRRATRRLLRITQDPARYLNSVLIAALACQVLGTALATAVAVRRLGGAGEWVAAAIMTAVLFVFTESAPKTFAIQHTDRVATALAPFVYAVGRILHPVSRLLIVVSNVLLPGRGLPRGPFVSEAELRHIVDVAEEEEVIEERERAMIHSIFELGDTVVREVMVPRPDMAVVEAHKSIKTAMDLAIRKGFSRIPVFEKEPDNIVGVVYAKDLFKALRRNGQKDQTVADLMREPYFVPETMRVSDLLREMQTKRVHMAVVVDEYGDVAGLATLEDVLEEIVGEITDEYDVEESNILPVADELWRVQAKLPIWELNELLDAELPEDEEWQTVGGMVSALLGKLPEAGEEVDVGRFRFRVEKVQRRRIGTVLVRRLEVITPDGAADAGT